MQASTASVPAVTVSKNKHPVLDSAVAVPKAVTKPSTEVSN